METEVYAILMFLALLFFLFLGHPLGYVLGGLAAIFGYLIWGPGCFYMFANRTFSLMSNYIMVAVPLFIFMAFMLSSSGLAERLYSAMHLVMGGLPGGLAIGTILIATLFAAATGVVGASVVSMGVLALPAMLERRYNIELATGSICTGGTLGILIPPSIMLVVLGPVAGLSVGKLYAGAILPGLLLSALYLTYVTVRCLMKKELGPPIPPEERAVPISKKIAALFLHLIPTIGLIVCVLGSIFWGIATPTEGAAIGAFGSIGLAAVYRKLTWKSLIEAVHQTIRVTSMIMVVAIGANSFTAVFLGIGGGDVVTDLLLGLGLGKWGILAVMMIILFILGALIDWLGIILICVPLFMPIATKLGFDPLWFAIVICVNLQLSFITPPFAYALFYLKGIAPPQVTTLHLYRGIVPFVALQAVGLLLCILFPEIILILPNLLIK